MPLKEGIRDLCAQRRQVDWTVEAAKRALDLVVEAGNFEQADKYRDELHAAQLLRRQLDRNLRDVFIELNDGHKELVTQMGRAYFADTDLREYYNDYYTHKREEMAASATKDTKIMELQGALGMYKLEVLGLQGDQRDNQEEITSLTTKVVKLEKKVNKQQQQLDKLCAVSKRSPPEGSQAAANETLKSIIVELRSAQLSLDEKLSQRDMECRELQQHISEANTDNETLFVPDVQPVVPRFVADRQLVDDRLRRYRRELARSIVARHQAGATSLNGLIKRTASGVETCRTTSPQATAVIAISSVPDYATTVFGIYIDHGGNFRDTLLLPFPEVILEGILPVSVLASTNIKPYTAVDRSGCHESSIRLGVARVRGMKTHWYEDDLHACVRCTDGGKFCTFYEDGKIYVRSLAAQFRAGKARHEHGYWIQSAEDVKRGKEAKMATQGTVEEVVEEEGSELVAPVMKKVRILAEDAEVVDDEAKA